MGVKVIAFVVALGAMFRATTFLHELAHLRSEQAPGVRLAWNLLWGAPLMVPSWLYERMHGDHHRPNLYGTAADPEYPPLGTHSTAQLVVWALMGLWLPVLLLVRFALVAPLSFLVPGGRAFVLARLSALTVNTEYRPRALQGSAKRFALLTEGLAMLAAWGWIAMAMVAPHVVVFLALLMLANMALQQLRTTLAHRYTSRGEMMDEEDVHADSYNLVPRSQLLRLLLPVGARLHALHHIAPGVPFHHLEAAHQRLVDWLPPEASYHDATATSLRVILADLLVATRTAANAKTVEVA
jgi:fatty acid desaturase